MKIVVLIVLIALVGAVGLLVWRAVSALMRPTLERAGRRRTRRREKIMRGRISRH